MYKWFFLNIITYHLGRPGRVVPPLLPGLLFSTFPLGCDLLSLLFCFTSLVVLDAFVLLLFGLLLPALEYCTVDIAEAWPLPLLATISMVLLPNLRVY